MPFTHVFPTEIIPVHTVGSVLSIQVTVAMSAHVFQYMSMYVKVYEAFPVNVYVHELVIVTHVLLNHVIVAMTS